MKLIKKLSEYKIRIIKAFFENPSNAKSVEVWKLLQKTMERPPSRASVINFLNELVEGKYLEYIEQSSKGGYHRLYFLELSDKQFINKIYKDTQAQLDELLKELK